MERAEGGEERKEKGKEKRQKRDKGGVVRGREKRKKKEFSSANKNLEEFSSFCSFCLNNPFEHLHFLFTTN